MRRTSLHRPSRAPWCQVLGACLILAVDLWAGEPAVASLPKAIAIQPFAGMPAAQVEEVARALERYYRRPVRILPAIALPASAFTRVKTPRYRADQLLEELAALLPSDCDYILGLTAQDISTTKYEDWAGQRIKQPEWKYADWGIFGLGQMPGPACIVSTFRLKNGVSETKLRERLRKVACHELGHNLGLPHCAQSETCFMRDGAESIVTVDAESESLCAKCSRMLGLAPEPCNP